MLDISRNENAYHLTQNFLNKQDKPYTSPIFHYTSVEVLQQIIEKQCLFATHIKYMNDWQEYEKGYKLLTKKLNMELELQLIDLPSLHDIKKSLKRSCPNVSQYDSILSEKGARSFKKLIFPEVYAVSFCASGDLLSQWAIYSKESGVSIEFDFTDFRFTDAGLKRPRDINDEEWNTIKYYEFNKPHKIIYDNKEKFNKIEAKVKETIKNIKNMTRDVADFGEKQNKELRQVIANLYALVPYFKTAAFKGENEIRIAFREIEEVVNDSEVYKTEIYHRHRKNMLIPFMKIGWEALSSDSCPYPIKSITIGPGNNQDVVYKSIIHFMENQKSSRTQETKKSQLTMYNSQYVTKSGIRIKKSRIPYIF